MIILLVGGAFAALVAALLLVLGCVRLSVSDFSYNIMLLLPLVGIYMPTCADCYKLKKIPIY